MVPSEDSRLLATPFGLLLNELHRSPQGLVASLLSLLKQGLECDSGAGPPTAHPLPWLFSPHLSSQLMHRPGSGRLKKMVFGKKFSIFVQHFDPKNFRLFFPQR